MEQTVLFRFRSAIAASCVCMSIFLFVTSGVYGQNALVGPGFSSGWGGGGCPTGNGNFNYMSAGAGTSYILTTTSAATGDRFWRFGIDWGGTTAQRTNTIGSDVTVTPNTTYSLNSSCTTSGSLKYNVASTSYNYVFKTLNAGSNPTGTWVFFEIQGAVSNVLAQPSGVTQSPTSAIVVPSQPVTVTANLNAAFNAGQALYLRYTNDNYVNSTVVQMQGSGTVYTAQIPPIMHQQNRTISYYVFTSGTANVAANGSNADLFTINLNNNGGSNFSYAIANNPIVVNATSGTAGPTGYATLLAAVNAINAGTHQGAVTISVVNNSTEGTSSIVMNASGIGSANYTGITVRPTGAFTVSAATTAGNPLLDLNGVDNLTIDGVNSGGLALTISNTTASATSGTSTIRFRDDATSNTITNCSILGSSTMPVGTNGGNIWFGTTSGSTGNDNNTISRCDIGPAGANLPSRCLYFGGTGTADPGTTNSGIVITNNNIFNYFLTGASTAHSAGIDLQPGTTNITISYNRFYQTATRSQSSSGSEHSSIRVNNTSGNNYQITGNVIGYIAPVSLTSGSSSGTLITVASTSGLFPGMLVSVSSGTGVFAGFTVVTAVNSATQFTVSADPTSALSGATISASAGTGTYTLSMLAATKFYPIYLSAGSTSATSMQGNTITGITMTGSAAGTGNSPPFSAIYVNAGVINIGNSIANVIGSQSATGAISYTTNSSSNSDISAIQTISSHAGALNTSNNLIGGITGGNSSSGWTNIYPLLGSNNSAATWTCSNNVVGGTVASSIQSTSTSTSSAVNGINAGNAENTIIGNTIRNLTVVNGTGSGASSSVIGISVASSGNQTVSQNIIHTLENLSTGSSAVTVTGIRFSGSTAGPNLVERNFVHSLSVATSVVSNVNGIAVIGGTTTYQNNMVRLGINGAGSSVSGGHSFSGINDLTGGTSNFYHNSIYIGGTGVTGTTATYAMNSSISSGTRNFINNVFYNARSNGSGSGKHYAVRLGGTGVNPAGLTSDFNLFLANGTGAVLGFYQSADRTTLSNWRTATGQDLSSISSDPVFLNSTGSSSLVDLHVNGGGTPVEQAGTPVSTVTGDYDGSLRSGLTPVDIGADAGNFTVAPDLTAPVFSYTAFDAATCVTGNRTISGVVITDASGLPSSPTLSTSTTRPRIYFRKSTGSWSSGSSSPGTYVSGTATNSIWDFTIDVSLISGGVNPGDVIQYFIIAQDAAGTPNIRSVPGTGLVATNVNSISTYPTSPNSYSVNYTLNGSYNVGTAQSAPFNTLQGAIGVYNAACLTGPTTFVLTDASYTPSGSVAVNANVDASATNTLTIRPAASQPVVVAASVSSNPLIDLNGSDYIIIDGINTGGASLTLRNTSTNGPVVRFQADASNNTIQNAVVEGPSSSSSSGVIYIAQGTTTGNDSNTLTGNTIRDRSDAAGVPNTLLFSETGTISNSNWTIQGNTFRNFTNKAIAFTGTGASNSMDNVTISGNTILQDASRTTGLTGIDFAATGTNVIQLNTIRNLTTSSTSGMTGINLTDARSTTLSANRIYNFPSTGTLTGILLTGSNGNPVSVTAVNNQITIVPGSSASQSIYGIRDNSGSAHTFNVYYNSVYIGGTATGSATWAFQRATGISSTVTLTNNIFNNGRTGGSVNHFAAGDQSNGSGTFTSNYNIFVGTGTTAANFLDRGTSSSGTAVAFSGAGSWQGSPAARDANSTAGNPGASGCGSGMFTDTSVGNLNIEMTYTPLLMSNTGTPITGYGADFAGDTRSATTPDIGSDEIASNACSAIGSVSSDTQAAPAGPFCGSGAPVLSFTGTFPGVTITYSWEFSTDGTNYSAVSPAQTNATYSPGNITATRWYRCVISCSGDASTKTSTPLQVVVNPIPTASASSNSAACAGAALNLTGTTDVGATHTWTGPNGFSSATLSPSINPVSAAAAGVYTFSTVSAAGCQSATSNTTVLIRQAPGAPVITPANPSSICIGDGVALSASSSGITGPLEYGSGASTTVGNTALSTLGPNPLQNHFGGSKQQMLFTLPELVAQGLTAGTLINSIAFNMPSARTDYALNSFTVRMKNSSTTDLAASWETGLTTVRSGADFTPSATGWNIISFDTPFSWDGSSNLVVELVYSNDCFNCSLTTKNTATFDATGSVTTTRFYRVDNATFSTVDGFSGAPSFTYTSRNQVRFGVSSAITYAWTPTTGLTPANGLGASVTAAPSATQAYTVTASNGTCSAQSNVTVNVNGNAQPVTTSGAASGIGGTSATVAGSYALPVCPAVTGYGVEYSLTNNFTPGTGTQVVSTNQANGAFTSALINLIPGQTYYFRAYATNASGTGYGAQDSFATTDPVITVTPTSLDFGNVASGLSSGELTYTVSGTNLYPASGSLTITPPSNYQVSLSSGSGWVASPSTLSVSYTGGALSATTIYVQFLPTAINTTYNVNIANAGGSAPVSPNVAVSGNSTENNYVTFDNFNRADNTVVGAPSSGVAGLWTEAETGGTCTPANTIVRIQSGRLELSNCNQGGSGSCGGTNASKNISFDVSARYATTFEHASGTLEWYFNMQQTRTDPAGLVSGAYGAAFVIGANEANLSTGTVDGYAVTFGDDSSDAIRLIAFTDGFPSNAAIGAATIASMSSPTAKTNYLSVRVTYNPCSQQWSLLVRDDGASAFANPTDITGTPVTGSNALYTNTPLNYIGAYWSHSSVCEDMVRFDNIWVPSVQASLNTYTWNGASDDFQSAGNWTPTRNCTKTNDVLQFNASSPSTSIVTNVPNQSIGRLLITGNRSVTLRDGAGDNASSMLTIVGGTGTDVQVEAGSSLTLDVASSNATTDAMIISLAGGGTADVSGNLSFINSNTGSAARDHRFLAADANAVTITGIVTAADLGGSPFGDTGASGVAVFQNGSRYVSQDGSNPFALAQPASKVVFQTGSTYSHEQTTAPSLFGRTYSNFEFNHNGTVSMLTGSTTGSWILDNLSVLQGTFTLSGATNSQPVSASIKGSVSVSNGATLNWSPAVASSLTLSGSSQQTVSGAGAITLGANLTLSVDNDFATSPQVLLQRNLTQNGPLTLTEGAFGLGGNTFTLNGNTINRDGTSQTGQIDGSVSGSTLVLGNTASLTIPSGTFSGVLFNLTDSGSGTVVLGGNVTVGNTLTMSGGNIDCGANTLELGTSTSSVGSLAWTSGTIIGRLKRWINQTGVSIAYPVGTASSYREAAVRFGNLTNGSLTGRFVATDPGSSGLPLSESSQSLENQFTEGYWALVSGDGLESSGYNLDLTATDFTSQTLNADTRIVKRADGGGSWTLNGSHSALTGGVAKRTGMSGFSEFGLAAARPCLTGVDNPTPGTQSVCVNTAISSITVAPTGGTAPFSFQWYSNADNNNTTGTSLGSANGAQTATYSPPTSGTEGTTYYYCVVTQNGSACGPFTSATSRVQITPDATISLSSEAGTNVQSACTATAITPITYAIGGGGTGAGASGLPTGLTSGYLNGVFTISGTPSSTGTFNYTVTTTGTCTQTSLGGTITVLGAATYYLDADGDGYAKTGQPSIQACVGSVPANYFLQNQLISITGDCVDNNADINAGADEWCNGIDDNCDGQIDEFLANAWYYRDYDGDGFGDLQAPQLACAQPAQYVSNSTDCNDNAATIYPNAPELDDNLDNDCDGIVDEGFGPVNDMKESALHLNTYVGACVTVNGTLVDATVSPQSGTTVVSGEDVWYYFTANSADIQIQCFSTTMNILLELQTATGTLVNVENALSTVGNEYLNYSGLTIGNTYYVRVRNYDSSQGTAGAFTLCGRRLPSSGCNLNSYNGGNPYSTCRVFQVLNTGASVYSCTFTSTTVPSGMSQAHVVTLSTQSGLTIVPLTSLIPGLNYSVSVSATYNLTNSAGTSETLTLLNSNACTITMSAHGNVQLRDADDCPKINLANMVIGANTWICGATYYQWRFVSTGAGPTIMVNGQPGNRFLAMSQVVAAGLTAGTYNVTIRPWFSGGVVAGSYGSVVCFNYLTTSSADSGFDPEQAELTSGVTDIGPDNGSAAGLLLYPNPNRGDQVIVSLSGIEGPYSIQVFDALGRVVWSNQIMVNETAESSRVITFGKPLDSGVYEVWVNSTTGEFVSRLLIQR